MATEIKSAIEIHINEYVSKYFKPAMNIAEADLLLSTRAFAVLLETNFPNATETLINEIVKVLTQQSFIQHYFDGEMVWMICHKK